MDNTTIAALATASGRGGIGIIRLSGPDALDIGQTIAGRPLTPRHAHFGDLRRQSDIVDSGICIYFQAPHSFTGEDVVELQAHGGPVLLDMLLQESIRLGAKHAEPGEFSQRAYLNGKLDLTQAEAIADLIASATEQAALNASRSLQGAFSSQIQTLVEKVIGLRVFIEAAIDFPEEEIDFIAQSDVHSQLLSLQEDFHALERGAQQGSLIRDGMQLVIVGKPNAGKSSLLNALSGQDAAIVTPTAGTTRDVLRETIQIDGMPIHLVDTAGLRQTDDVIEREGVKRAWKEVATADHLLLVVDGSDDAADTSLADQLSSLKESTHAKAITIIYNKSDIRGETPRKTTLDAHDVIYLSAKTGLGLDLLTAHLKASVGFQDTLEGGFSARRRHLQALENAKESLENGIAQLQDAAAAELLAEDLRQCQQALGSITGEFTSDQLLGEIFSSFCIGK